MLNKCYISGAITGCPDFEARFAAAEQDVTRMGMIPVNPCNLPHEHSRTWEDYMREDVAALMKCSHMYMTTGWEQSRGAAIEHFLASQFKYTIFYQ